ncbi:MAG: PQQ-binding-like beta-propeller repeat protein [Steroidobacteraceae bacterium]
MKGRWNVWRALGAMQVGLLAATLAGAAGEWEYYGATQGGVRYSALWQINRQTVGDLQVAWTYRTGELERYGKAFAQAQAFQDTPTLVGGSLIVCTPAGRLIALDPKNGRQRWVFDPQLSMQSAGAGFMPRCRGVTPWVDDRVPRDAPCAQRLIYGTWAFRVYAVDARTGRRCSGFGQQGEVVLERGRALDPNEFIQVSSPPVVVRDVIFGSAIRRQRSRRLAQWQGARARCAQRRGALGVRSGSARRSRPRRVPGATAPVPAAPMPGRHCPRTSHATPVFVPTTSASPDYYGATRPGDNLREFRLSRCEPTPASPSGTSRRPITTSGTTTCLRSRSSWICGAAEEPSGRRAADQTGAGVRLQSRDWRAGIPRSKSVRCRGAVPGEWLSPTQPFPVAPAPLAAQGMQPDDAWGFTYFDRRSCRRQIEALRHDGVYTPPSLQGTIYMPAFLGGANWGSGAYDPGRQWLYVNTLNAPGVTRLIPRGANGAQAPKGMTENRELDLGAGVMFAQRGTPYEVETRMLMSPLGAPCSAPPWGRLAAVDLAEGRIRWQVALGSIEKINPAHIPLKYGTPNAGGAVVTAGNLVFIAASMDDKFRAFDADTGKVLWTARLPAGGQATPMTYAVDGRQYVVIAAGGHALLSDNAG